MEKFTDPQKLANVQREYDLLKENIDSLNISLLSEDFLELKKINLSIWNTEDSIRRHEAKKSFGKDFVQLARNVYIENDRRAAIKRTINLKYCSLIVEEKEYTDYSCGHAHGPE